MNWELHALFLFMQYSALMPKGKIGHFKIMNSFKVNWIF